VSDTMVLVVAVERWDDTSSSISEKDWVGTCTHPAGTAVLACCPELLPLLLKGGCK